MTLLASAQLSLFFHFGWVYIALKKRRVPEAIIIEPTNVCNLRCPVCPTHFAMTRSRGFMELSLYRRIIDELQSLPKKPIIQFRLCGEPLLHPDIAEFVRYAQARGHSTMIATNCTRLNEELGCDLIEAGLSEIVLALDGFSKESYEAYRKGARFETVVKNIEGFVRIRSKFQKSTPKVIIQTLLTSGSESEVEQMKEWAGRIGADQINFKSLSMGIYTTSAMKDKYSYLLPKEAKLRRTMAYPTRYCLTPLKHIMIYWDGHFGLCCKDFDNTADLPSVTADGFLKTFYSPAVQEKRTRGMFRQLRLCADCDMHRFPFKGFSFKFR